MSWKALILSAAAPIIMADLEELLEEHEVLFREIEDKISGINGK